MIPVPAYLYSLLPKNCPYPERPWWRTNPNFRTLNREDAIRQSELWRRNLRVRIVGPEVLCGYDPGPKSYVASISSGGGFMVTAENLSDAVRLVIAEVDYRHPLPQPIPAVGQVWVIEEKVSNSLLPSFRIVTVTQAGIRRILRDGMKQALVVAEFPDLTLGRTPNVCLADGGLSVGEVTAIAGPIDSTVPRAVYCLTPELFWSAPSPRSEGASL